MKVLCSGCEAAEARVLCCADEAALCALCDRDVHAANRLAGKHHACLSTRPPPRRTATYARSPTPTSSASRTARCSAGAATSPCTRPTPSSPVTAGSSSPASMSARSPTPPKRLLIHTRTPETPPHPQQHQLHCQIPGGQEGAQQQQQPAPLYYSDDEIIDVGITGNLPDWQLVDEQLSAPPVPRPPAEPLVTRAPSKRMLAPAFTVQGGLAGGMPDWPLDDFFDGFSEFSADLGFTENGTSKRQAWSNDGSPTGRSSSDSAQDMFGQVPEVHQWSVPELIPSPPTASGLHWHGGAAAVSVPDISSPENPFRCFAADAGQAQTAAAKRRRRC
ncbi:hypothetical protein HU200_027831 [Digitaria exilis]|uniref:B box-type domain-containing protein n=1 Tax=Digitaria exilis TaxID=1010633 RepID=A0A835C176_9POAL|nr:hypothetical protein HU200_027831 [Digitaria exilis]